LRDELKAIGLTTYQSRALEALLMKKLTLKELCKEADIPPGKVYSVAKQLQQKGLIKATPTHPKVLYVENASGVISTLAKEHEARQQHIITTLQEAATSLDTQAGATAPFFDLGTTVEDNGRIQMRTFAESEKEVLQIINKHHKPQTNRKSKTMWERGIEQAVERGVVFSVIYPVEMMLPKILERLAEERPGSFQVKRLDTHFIRCDIIDRKKVLLKLVHEDPLTFGGIIFVENRKFAENLRNVFYKFWDEASDK